MRPPTRSSPVIVPSAASRAISKYTGSVVGISARTRPSG
jgi:hypothetical protein